MRPLSWLASFSVVVGVGVATATAVHGFTDQTTVLVGASSTFVSATNAYRTPDDSAPMNIDHAPLTLAPQPGRARPPAHRAPAAATPTRVTVYSIAIGSGQQVLVNRDRAGAGLRPLTWSSCLASIALANARRMAGQGYISHTNGPTLDLGCRLGVRAGENVGWWSGGVNDAQLNTMFMNSPDHRANIMGPYRYVATAWAVAPNGSAYIAVEFA
jgi:uncharacterized protein YkwD